MATVMATVTIKTMISVNDNERGGDFDQQWYVLYTKSRHEKKVAHRLKAMGFTVYCPLKKISKR